MNDGLGVALTPLWLQAGADFEAGMVIGIRDPHPLVGVPYVGVEPSRWGRWLVRIGWRCPLRPIAVAVNSGQKGDLIQLVSRVGDLTEAVKAAAVATLQDGQPIYVDSDGKLRMGRWS